MKKFKLPSLAMIVGVIVISCNPTDEANSQSYIGKEYYTQSGLGYQIHKAGEGDQAKAGDLVTVHYAGRLEDGTEFDNSYKKGTPFTFQLGAGKVIKGWDEGIALLNVGDSATLIIPSYLGYGDRNMGVIKPGSTLIFDVELVATKKPTKPWKLDGKEIVDVRPGLQMIYLERNENGVKAENGKTVTVNYSGYFNKNNRKFDSSVDKGTPFSFVLGQGMVIQGWDLGVAEMRTGEKARLIIDADLAYGDRGMGPIPPNAKLYFDVELLSVQ